jgi:hypothetical protein
VHAFDLLRPASAASRDDRAGDDRGGAPSHRFALALGREYGPQRSPLTIGPNGVPRTPAVTPSTSGQLTSSSAMWTSIEARPALLSSSPTRSGAIVKVALSNAPGNGGSIPSAASSSP